MPLLPEEKENTVVREMIDFGGIFLFLLQLNLRKSRSRCELHVIYNTCHWFDPLSKTLCTEYPNKLRNKIIYIMLLERDNDLKCTTSDPN